MKLSIITINYNNAEGLKKTLASVASQTYPNIEHIIVDGGSTDGSVDVIKEYEEKPTPNPFLKGREIKWVSEPDKGIYNAMNKGIEIALDRRIVNSFNRSTLCGDKNKGIEIALGKRVVDFDHTSSFIGVPAETNDSVSHGESGGTCHPSIKQSGIDHCDLVAERGHTSNITHNTSQESLCDYIQILNSGDLLAAPDVTERMMAALGAQNDEMSRTNVLNEPLSLNDGVAVLYGNMLKSYDGKTIINRDTCGGDMYTPESFLYFYKGTLNHDCAYIRRDLFEKYGLYNEQMKICSDWEWYVRTIVLGGEKPVYTNIDVTIFDMNGVSESYGKNADIIKRERREYLEKILPPSVLHDYDAFSLPILQYQRLKKYHLWGLVYFMERVLFKLNKWGILR